MKKKLSVAKSVEESIDELAQQFPVLEKVLMESTPSKLASHFESLQDKIEKTSRAGSRLGKQKETRKALRAVEHVADLMKELFRAKDQVESKK